MKDLLEIVVLYRQPDTMSLWGIPYRMRDGQQPYDIERGQREAYDRWISTVPRPHYSPKDPRDAWAWLGTPGWWGSMSPGRQRAVQAYLEPLRGIIPVNPAAWTYVEVAAERFRRYAEHLHRDADVYADHFRPETSRLRMAARICERYARNYTVLQK